MTRTLPNRILATLGALAVVTLLVSGCARGSAAAGRPDSAAPGGGGRRASASSSATPPQPPKRRLATMPLPAPMATIAQPTKPKTLTGPRTMPVPILMYHAIDTAPANAPYPDLYVTPKQFAAQLNYLTSHGFHAVTMQQVYDFWHGKGTLPSKPVVLTFDDGFTGDFVYAAPLLKSVNWPATLFLIVGKRKPRMPASMVRSMIENGWELGSHTIRHQELPKETTANAIDDITHSRAILSKRFDQPVNFFCYPSGAYNAANIAEVKKAGYLAATTTHPALARPGKPYELSRVRISGSESLASFAAAVSQH